MLCLPGADPQLAAGPMGTWRLTWRDGGLRVWPGWSVTWPAPQPGRQQATRPLHGPAQDAPPPAVTRAVIPLQMVAARPAMGGRRRSSCTCRPLSAPEAAGRAPRAAAAQAGCACRLPAIVRGSGCRSCCRPPSACGALPTPARPAGPASVVEHARPLQGAAAGSRHVELRGGRFGSCSLLDDAAVHSRDPTNLGSQGRNSLRAQHFSLQPGQPARGLCC
jgi:hypothetical protein